MRRLLKCLIICVAGAALIFCLMSFRSGMTLGRSLIEHPPVLETTAEDLAEIASGCIVFGVAGLYATIKIALRLWNFIDARVPG